MLTSVERNLPPEYAGWQEHEPELRRMSTSQLVEEIQDGPPDRRLAAMSVIDLASVSQDIVVDWIRTLPDAEANELAGAIPAQRHHASTDDDLRWIDLSRLGYERRRLPTFLVTLFASLETVESKDPDAAARIWDAIAIWARDNYRLCASDGDATAMNDLLLFVFENYLEREPVFNAFLELLADQPDLALRVSANPAMFIAGLPLEKQRACLDVAGQNGGLPFDVSWKALHDA